MPFQAGAGEEVSRQDIDLEVEVPVPVWAPIEADKTNAVTDVVFIDGVRRVEARIWATGDDGTTRQGLCASYAAGAVRSAPDQANVEQIIVERGLFSRAGVEAIDTAHGRFEPYAASSDLDEQLVLALQMRMADVEARVAMRVLEDRPASLCVVDGPIRLRGIAGTIVGYVKTHHVQYLPAELHACVARLKPAERTPLVLIQRPWSRYSFYLKLRTPDSHPWAGVVRIELLGDLPLPGAQKQANTVAATIPRYASEPYRDPRAPQNLTPIGALERELRHRLGDHELIVRGLRKAASTSTASP